MLKLFSAVLLALTLVWVLLMGLSTVYIKWGVHGAAMYVLSLSMLALLAMADKQGREADQQELELDHHATLDFVAKQKELQARLQHATQHGDDPNTKKAS